MLLNDVRVLDKVNGRGERGSEFVCEGFHGADSAAGGVREGLIPGHLREGDRVSRFPDISARR